MIQAAPNLGNAKKKGCFFGDVIPKLSNWIDYLHATMVRIVRKGIMRDIYWF